MKPSKTTLPLTTLIISLLTLYKISCSEVLTGFTATPDPSVALFQPLLNDSTGNYSLGFLRSNGNQLALAILHLPSSVPFWTANNNHLATWGSSTILFFNGSLVITDPRTRVFWSTYTDGDRVWLSNSSNLQIQQTATDAPNVLWQSFDFPTDTLVENQNFTTAMTLVSSNGLYSMKLGYDFIGLYARFGSGSGQMYLQHKALEAKASVVEGQGPIYAVLSPDGFLGMYQNSSIPVDVQAFNSFQQPGRGNRRIRLEPDGNLKGYYWTGSDWVLDFQEISDTCELPSACGSYGLCRQGEGCSCLNNQTEYILDKCESNENKSGDFCNIASNKFRVMRKSRVELPYKELMSYTIMGSFDKCESTCESNCTCWGAVYSNSSGFCYMLSYPIQTLLSVDDETKLGYFKLREGAGKDKEMIGFGIGMGLLCGTILVFCGVVGLGYFRYLKRKRGVSGYVEDDGVGNVGPYKDLGSASFKSIELSVT